MEDPKRGTPLSPLEMTDEEMRRLGYWAVDLIVDRWARLGEGPAWQGASRRELEPILRESPPEGGRGPEEVLQKVVREVLPRAGRIDHPRFFAFIPSSPTWPSILGDLLASGFNVFAGTWLESAGPSQVELVVMDWFRSWVGLPETGGGLFTSGGSVANLVALVAAREWAGSPANPVIYLSDQGHSSLERAAHIAGIPQENVRKIPTDPAFRMDLAALSEAIRLDRSRGMRPLCVCGNAGATNTGAIDPLEGMADVAGEEGLWFHVDGAYGGFAVLAPGQAAAFAGLGRADSITLDPHKWLFQPYETGCLLVRDTSILEEAFRILPEYLQDVALGKEHVNFADRGVQLTRGFRALKVYVSIQTLGLRAFREAIAEGIRLAGEAERYVRASAELEMTGPASLGIVCFRFAPSGHGCSASELEEVNRSIQEEIVASGRVMMSSTRLRDLFSLRLSILNYRSTWDDVREALEAVERVGRRRMAERGARL